MVRAFALMTGGKLPVTLPINATDDRVLGGWELDALMRGEAKRQTGLLEEAHEKGMLYVDEVNLLDDHIVNIILDVVSTGVLSVQREGIDTETHVSFGLVGTMNPEEGSLRAQLLDRFGLMVTTSELDTGERHRMITTVLTFEEERDVPGSDWLRTAEEENRQQREGLLAARGRIDRRAARDGRQQALCRGSCPDRGRRTARRPAGCQGRPGTGCQGGGTAGGAPARAQGPAVRTAPPQARFRSRFGTELGT